MWIEKSPQGTLATNRKEKLSTDENFSFLKINISRNNSSRAMNIHLHNLCYLVWRWVRKMPRFTESIRTHKIHSMHMTLGLFGSISFKYLHASWQEISALWTRIKWWYCNCLFNYVNYNDIKSGQIPHLVTPEKGRSGQFENHVEWEQDPATHQHQQISCVQHLALELKGQGDPREEVQITMVLQKCILTLQE